MLRVLPWKTQLLTPLVTKTGELNSKVEFQAQVSLPAPSNIKMDEIEWYFDGDRITSDESSPFITNILDDGYTHSLLINKIAEEMMNKEVRQGLDFSGN